MAPWRKESPISLLFVTTCGFGDPKSTVSARCVEQSVSTVRVVAWSHIVPLKITCIFKCFVWPAAKTLRFVPLGNTRGDLAGSVGNRIRNETNWPSGYYLFYYNRNLRHYNIDSAAVNMILMDLSLFHVIFC